jgi:hypothetical protein
MNKIEHFDGTFEGIEATNERAIEIAKYFGVDINLENSTDITATIERRVSDNFSQWCIVVDGYMHHCKMTTDTEFEEAISLFDID